MLQEKAGSKGSLREFRRMVREIIEAHTLPEYRMTLDDADKVTFYVRNPQRLIAGLTKGNKADAVHSYTRNPKRVPPKPGKSKQ